MQVSLIIPAYNEEKTMRFVLKAAREALELGVVSEVLVVDDGSEDKTKEVAEEAGFRVVRSQNNVGKAGAMTLGALNTSGELLLFWDADLIGSSVNHFRDLIKPLENRDDCNMTIGRMIGRDIVTLFGQTLTPQLSGQRVIRRKVFERLMEVEGLEKAGFAIELITIKFFKENKLKYVYVNLRDISIVTKEQKQGLIGFKHRLIMYKELLTFFTIDINKRKVKQNVSSISVKNK